MSDAVPHGGGDDREPIRFFLPGPAYVTERVRQAMTEPVVGHRSPAFRARYARVATGLETVFRTSRPVPFATGSATLVMEAAIASTVERDVLHLTCGAFSERWQAISQSLGKHGDRLEVPWGQAIDPDLVRRALGRKRYEAVTVVHNETSTGVINPLADIARVVGEASDALLLVDAVSSLGGAPVETDAWGLDLVLTGSQKALAAPPGIVPFSLSARAEERAARVAPRGFYTDLVRYLRYHREGGTITTPAVPVVYALERQLEVVAAEGIEERWRRHRRLEERTAEWAAARGLGHSADAAVRSPTVTCLEAPDGIAAPELVAALAERGFTVGGGYGRWKADTWRIGHMGEVRESDLDALFAAADEILATA